MKLSESDIRRRLGDLNGWAYDGKQLTRRFEFPSFAVAIRCVNQVAAAAEAANHHPDIDIRYKTVQFGLSTHSEGGVSEKDFSLGLEINRLAVG